MGGQKEADLDVFNSLFVQTVIWMESSPKDTHTTTCTTLIKCSFYQTVNGKTVNLFIPAVNSGILGSAVFCCVASFSRFNASEVI